MAAAAPSASSIQRDCIEEDKTISTILFFRYEETFPRNLQAGASIVVQQSKLPPFLSASFLVICLFVLSPGFGESFESESRMLGASAAFGSCLRAGLHS